MDTKMQSHSRKRAFFNGFFLIAIVHLCSSNSIINAMCNSLTLRDQTSTILVSAGSTLVFSSKVSDFNGTLSRQEGGVLSGQSIDFNGGIFIDAGQQISLSGQLGSDTLQLSGNQSYRGTGQIITQIIQIASSNNRLEGEILLLNDLSLLDINSSYTHALTRSMNQNIVLNGGIVYLEEDLRFVAGKVIQGPGIVVLNNRILEFGAQDITLDTPIYFDTASNISLNSDLYLSDSLTFSGSKNIVFGNGHNLFLESSGQIIVEAGSTLELHNVVINGLLGSNIFCKDNAGTLIFNNCTLALSSDFAFSVGSLVIKNNVIVSGNFQFNYCTSQPSTISSLSTLYLDQNMTFSYDPVVANKNLIQFTDSTSILYMNASTLVTTSTGMALLNGRLIVEGSVDLIAQNSTNGFVVGDGNSPSDFGVQIQSGALLSLVKGSLYYNNVKSVSWNMINVSSQFALLPETTLHLFQSLNLGVGQLQLSQFAYLIFEPNMMLSGSVNSV